MDNKNLFKYSVIIPVYNVEKYLGKCLESLFSQEFKDFECIIVDDGSTDNSKLIVDEYSKKNQNIQYYYQQNQGQSVARNYAMLKAKGEYLLFLDSDDFIKENTFEILNKLTDQKPDIIVNSTIAYYENEEQYIPRNLNVQAAWHNGVQLLTILSETKSFMFAPWSIVVRREYLLHENILFYPGIKHEDELWVPLVIINAKKILVNEEPYYMGRCDRVGSTTQTRNIKKMLDKLVVMDELLKYGADKNKDIQDVLQLRCAKILTGIIKEVYQFKEDEKFEAVLKKIAEKKSVLKIFNSKRYCVMYVLIKCIGVKNVSRVWNKILT